MAKRCNHHHSIFPRFYLTCLVLFLNYKSSNFLDCIYTSSRSQIKSFVAHSEYLEAIESFESFQEAVVLFGVYVCLKKGGGGVEQCFFFFFFVIKKLAKVAIKQKSPKNVVIKKMRIRFGDSFFYY